MTVTGIAIDASTNNPIILLRDPSRRRQVPIWIDHAQAHNIMAGIKELNTDTPLCHDLILSLLELGQLKLEKVIIHSIEESSFQAVLKISKTCKENKKPEKVDDKKLIEIKARPSDAIALAVRTQCNIWMLEEVVAKASIPVDAEADKEDLNEFKRFIQDSSPSSLISYFENNNDNDEK